MKNTFNSAENVDSGLRRNDGYALTLTLSPGREMGKEVQEKLLPGELGVSPRFL